MSEKKFQVVTLPDDSAKLETLLNSGYRIINQYKAGDKLVMELTEHSTQLVKLEREIAAHPESVEEIKKWLKRFGKKEK